MKKENNGKYPILIHYTNAINDEILIFNPAIEEEWISY